MSTYYSPTGNPEIWREKPDGYFTPDEWFAANPIPEPPEPDLDELKAAKKAEIAAARWAQETGGLTIGGMTIATDRESQSLITGAVTSTLLDPSYAVRWKTADGFVELTAPMIQAVATAVRNHVQACFDREAELTAIIDACATAEEISVVAWG